MAKQWRKQASAAYGCALTRLALNGFLYFDEREEEEDGGAEVSRMKKETDDTFRNLLGAWLNGALQLSDIETFRERIRHEMETVVAYTDSFQIYEYALNRMERRFHTLPPASELSESAFAYQIMTFLSEAGDTANMNRRIQEVIAQLPVRFTRRKYYEMVRDALSSYIGLDAEALENIMYLLRTGAMVELDAERRAEYPKLDSRLASLEQIAFRELDAERYRNAEQTVSLASEMLMALSDNCQTMQEMANDLYLLALTREDAVRDAALEECAVGLLRGLLELDGKAIPEELEEALYKLEGMQEEYYEKYQRLEPAPEYREGEDAECEKMRRADLLMSTSAFVSLTEARHEGVVERADIDRAVDEFVTLVNPVLETCQKPVQRAIMATTLSALPVFFNSADEVQSYIRNSLESCTDFAEKETCKELILQLMESEDYEVL